MMSIFTNFQEITQNIVSKNKNLTSFSSSTSQYTSQMKCFKCFEFEHIAFNCPKKTTTMITKEGIIHNEQYYPNNYESSPSSSYNEFGVPYEGDLLMVRRIFGQVPKYFDITERFFFHRLNFCQRKIMFHDYIWRYLC